MSVDPRKPRKILIVHGVQSGNNARLNQDRRVRELVRNRMGGLPLRFTTELYRYEDVNDEAQKRLRQLLTVLSGTPVAGRVASEVIDVVGDVVTSLMDTSTAAEIRRGLRTRIMTIFERGQPCYLLAHSLGSIYALDVINQLMGEPELFARDSRRSWPVQGLVTIGSPIGLSMFRKSRPRLHPLGDGTKWFRWVNYYDLTDPVVSGDLFGRRLQGFKIAEQYLQSDRQQGWMIRDRPVDTGRLWLLAHTGYWDNPAVGDGLLDMVAN